MKKNTFILAICVCLFSCQNNQEKSIAVTTNDTSVSGEIKHPADVSETARNQSKPKQSIALTLNALQLVDNTSGSTTEIAFGKPMNDMVKIVSDVLQSASPDIQLNSECGAGPLKMASWSNGLTLVFEEGEKNWLFAGWFASTPKDTMQKLTTMSGIGVGSLRAELESAYTTRVFQSTLGTEFSISDGMFGILSGKGKDARITDIWSGVSCNFR